ncbi:MAG: TGS domain-containing protein [Chloroflexota bacterium]|nr:TGS domain-containing protein [Chloroflexota bacterium]
MPTNLPAEYYEAEEHYKAAQTPEAKITTLEDLISTIPKHKGTDKLRADLRKRLSKLKSAAQGKKGVSKQVSAFVVEKEGASQVAIIGAPNVGKSSLVAALTNASPHISPSPYTTWTPSPGMMLVDNVQIQLVDTPPVTGDFVEADLWNLIRNADLLLVVVDLQAYPIEQFQDTIALLQERKIVSEHQRDRVDNPRGVVFKPMVVVVNKCDDANGTGDCEVLRELLGDEWHFAPVSTQVEASLETLKQVIYDRLELMRVYSKPPGKDPDFTAPFVLTRGGTVEEFAAQVHKDFVEGLKSARVWGEGVFDGQMVGRDHVLHEGDVVELRI